MSETNSRKETPVCINDLLGNDESAICSSCSACMNACPKKAISMKQDEAGFMRPVVDTSLCVSCGICVNIHRAQWRPNETSQVSAWAARKKGGAMDSSSGGIASLIAKDIHDNGGYVFGAAMDADGNVSHIECAPDVPGEKRLEELKGSKYAQSDLKNTFQRIRELLSYSQTVLFIGTPCQVQGLNTYLEFCRADTEKLTTIDIVCHGVPSSRMFSEYLNSLEKMYSEYDIVRFTFRDKTLGWGKNGSAHFVSPISNIDDVHRKLWESNESFFYYFSNASLCQKACHQCQFADLHNRPADITLGDFWGIEKQHPDFEINDGVSAVICNTEKGQNTFDRIRNACELTETTPEKIAAGNDQLRHPSTAGDPELIHIYAQEGWKGVEARYHKISWLKRHKSQIKAMMPAWLKYRLKSLKGE